MNSANRFVISLHRISRLIDARLRWEQLLADAKQTTAGVLQLLYRVNVNDVLLKVAGNGRAGKTKGTPMKSEVYK